MLWECFSRPNLRYIYLLCFTLLKGYSPGSGTARPWKICPYTIWPVISVCTCLQFTIFLIKTTCSWLAPKVFFYFWRYQNPSIELLTLASSTKTLSCSSPPTSMFSDFSECLMSPYTCLTGFDSLFTESHVVAEELPESKMAGAFVFPLEHLSAIHRVLEFLLLKRYNLTRPCNGLLCNA